MNSFQRVASVLIVFPIVLFGFAIGFVYESISIGIFGGIRAVDSLGDGAAKLREEREKAEK